ncbi:hypothetical protein HNI00_07310 [Thermoleptolyngbya oregonensis NK1-22]|uniref:Uncharacterized protein n=1 Tax=Thermoleptolyngbya oregonensis NK1-22 TaxID=2547457 RepID=A0AA97BCH2_9CYAN|nr:hypothetical protein [Thermoleptolyngbya oregonensis]WOB42984.1 hypothetical protein HNI00_07310 [Thermoleptolyngbya oregonensis NK1-22]
MEDKFNPFGLLILVAAIAAAFTPIQEALDEQGMALYWPSFGAHPDDGSDEYWASVSASPAAQLPAAAAHPPVSGLGKLPPPPTAQGGPAHAAPPPTAPQPETWHISRANLDRLLQASGGIGGDGCLKNPVPVEGMVGYSRVEAVPNWQPGALLVFSIDAPTGAIECVEFAFDKESPQW